MKKLLFAALLMSLSLLSFATNPPIKNIVGLWQVESATMVMNVQHIAVAVDMSKAFISFQFNDNGGYIQKNYDFKIRQMDIIRAVTGKQTTVYPKVKDDIIVMDGRYTFRNNILNLTQGEESDSYNVITHQSNLITLQQTYAADGGAEIGEMSVKMKIKLKRIK